jgi:hypothetical protein
MFSLCSSLSISFNSSKHFHLYGSNASLAQVAIFPRDRGEELRGSLETRTRCTGTFGVGGLFPGLTWPCSLRSS